MEKEVRPGLRDKIGSKAKQVGLAVGGTIAAVAISCAPGAGRTENPAPSSPTVPTASGETMRPPAPTAESSSITITPAPEPPKPTPEARQEVPCQILPPEVCAKAELIELKYLGQTFKLLGFRPEYLPEGTPLYSHKDGRFNKGVTPGELFVGSFGAIMGKPGEGGFSVYGDIKFSNNSGDIKRGDIIGTIQNTGVTNFGEYNLIIMATRANAEGTRPETDTETLTRLFPGFSEMEPVKRIDKGNAPLKPSIGSPIYSDTPLSDKDK